MCEPGRALLHQPPVLFCGLDASIPAAFSPALFPCQTLTLGEIFPDIQPETWLQPPTSLAQDPGSAWMVLCWLCCRASAAQRLTGELFLLVPPLVMALEAFSEDAAAEHPSLLPFGCLLGMGVDKCFVCRAGPALGVLPFQNYRSAASLLAESLETLLPTYTAELSELFKDTRIFLLHSHVTWLAHAGWFAAAAGFCSRQHPVPGREWQL